MTVAEAVIVPELMSDGTEAYCAMAIAIAVPPRVPETVAVILPPPVELLFTRAAWSPVTPVLAARLVSVHVPVEELNVAVSRCV